MLVTGLCASVTSMFLAQHLSADVTNTRTHVVYSDLQNAIDAANSGDTLVIKGTQYGNFVVNKDLTLKGDKDAILDGSQTGTVLSVGTISNIVVYLERLTIQNGLANEGGGILNQATLNLSRVSVINNAANDIGGGIFNDGTIAHLYVSDSTIDNNTADSDGGGIYNNQGGLIVNFSEISYNKAIDGNGGGVYSFIGISVVTVSESKIEYNTALGGDGGGFYAFGSETDFDNVKFKWNLAENGGGIFNTDGSVLHIAHSKFERNSASVRGGGLYNDAGIINISHSEVEHNRGTINGGGIFKVFDQELNLYKTEVKHNSPDNIATGLLA